MCVRHHPRGHRQGLAVSASFYDRRICSRCGIAWALGCACDYPAAEIPRKPAQSNRADRRPSREDRLEAALRKCMEALARWSVCRCPECLMDENEDGFTPCNTGLIEALAAAKEALK